MVSLWCSVIALALVVSAFLFPQLADTASRIPTGPLLEGSIGSGARTCPPRPRGTAGIAVQAIRQGVSPVIRTAPPVGGPSFAGFAYSRAPPVPRVQLSKTEQPASDEAAQAALQARGPIPVHIAAIMDGNGRWAKAQGKGRVKGHREGVESVRDVTEACAQLGVGDLTLYTFSTENWGRPRAEVTALMELLMRTITREVDRLDANDIRLDTIGDLSRLPAKARREMEAARDKTAGNGRMTLRLALSYSGRWDLARAARRVADDVAAGRLRPDEVDEAAVAQRLSTAGVPDPDLLIRTGGDFRVSNYLLWEIAYAEIVVTDTFWPAFRREALYAAIGEFQDRERRFGRVPGAADDLQ